MPATSPSLRLKQFDALMARLPEAQLTRHVRKLRRRAMPHQPLRLVSVPTSVAVLQSGGAVPNELARAYKALSPEARLMVVSLARRLRGLA